MSQITRACRKNKSSRGVVAPLEVREISTCSTIRYLTLECSFLAPRFSSWPTGATSLDSGREWCKIESWASQSPASSRSRDGVYADDGAPHSHRQFEAWLSMQKASARGLVSEVDRRYTISIMHGAPAPVEHSLVEEWSHCTAQVWQ